VVVFGATKFLLRAGEPSWDNVFVQKHPLSTGFDWDDAVVPVGRRSLLTDEQWNQFVTDGYVVIDPLLDTSSLDWIRAETDRFCLAADQALGSMPDERFFIAERGAITFAPHLARQSDVLWDVITSSAIAQVARDVLGPEVRLYHDQAVYKSPEKPRRFPWHQDNGYGFVTPEHYLTIWIALSDATVESGCVWVTPGLQREGTLEHRYVDPLGWEAFSDPPVHPVAAPLKAGGAVVFSSLTPHLTGPNTSASMRKAYIVQFVGPGATRHEADGRRIALDDTCPALD